MDLQGYELPALHGATAALKNIDVIVAEFSFYSFFHGSSISALSCFPFECGFELYDMVSFSSRRRDGRCREGDFVFIRSDSELAADRGWA